jgi:fumarate hydratase class II
MQVSQISLLAEAMDKMAIYVIDRVTPLRERARELAEKSPALVTVISPIIGYDKATQVALKVAQGTPIRKALKEIGLSDEEIERILDLRRLTRPGIPAKEK